MICNPEVKALNESILAIRAEYDRRSAIKDKQDRVFPPSLIAQMRGHGWAWKKRAMRRELLAAMQELGK